MKSIISIIFFILWMNSMFAQVEQNIVSSDHTIHLKIFGEGTPILIINGGPGMNSKGFIPLAKTLGKTNQAIIYDQRGTGQSKMLEINATTITLDLMIDDIETIRKHLNIQQWVVLGHSFGGMLASYYAAKHPERIKGLVLSASGGINMDLFSRINITSRLTPQERDSLSYWNDRISKGDTSYHTRLRRGYNLAPAYLYDKSNVPIVAERLTQLNTTINQLVFQNMRKIGFDCAIGLKELKAPVLIIQGKEDIIDQQVAKTTLNVIENSDLVLLENCGHYGWLDQPKKYFFYLDQYLGSIK